MAFLDDVRSAIQSDCPHTVFPTAVDTLAIKQDINADTKSLVDNYSSLISSGNFASAAALLAENPVLQLTLMLAEDWNKMRDGLVAVQRVFNGYIADYIAAVVKSKGTWSSSATYEKYNVVTYTYNGLTRTYIALPQDEAVVQIPVGTKPVGSSDSAQYWVCITHEGLQGASGTGLSPRGGYASDVTYSKDDLVVYDGYLYLANENNIVGETPSSSSSKWTLLELSATSDLYGAGVNIAATDWTNKTHTITNAAVDANTLVEVYFNKSSFAAVAKAGIYVESGAGTITLTCIDDAPTEAIAIDYFRFRKDVEG